jgi:alanine dehydrogenase
VPTAVGIPKEIKDREGRVSMQPDAVVDELHHGREAIVQSGASKDSGFSGEEYESAGGAWSRAPARSSRLPT